MSEQLVLPLELENVATLTINSEDGSIVTEPVSETKPLSQREYEMAMRKAYKDRDEKVKENKKMLAEMLLEVSYWKAQSDLLKYRFEKMDYYLKNIALEPTYAAAVAEQQAKENAASEPAPTKSILS